MKKQNNWLLQHRKTVASQFGEDGVIEKIFSIIKEDRDKWCVEFGAGDGKWCSNTWHLIKNKGWTGALIEAESKRFEDLQTTYASIPQRVHLIQQFISFSGKNSLDNVLRKTGIPRNFDFLSIDIDGNDYHVWEALKYHSPKVVIIEFNPSIPSDIEFIQERDMNVRHGASLLALVNLARRKGYEMVYAQDGNAIFVKKNYFPLFEISNNSIEALYSDRKYETRMYQLFDGTIVYTGNKRLLWHGIEFNERRLQVLPKPLRKFSSNSVSFAILFLRFIRWHKPYISLSDALNVKKIKIVLSNLTFAKWKE